MHAAPRDVQDIAFAVPGQGLISLGVFDKAGKLVRTLHALDGEEAFRIGLNGYITQWDGCDDSGQKVPAGRYFVRGYLVGDVTVDGEAFHFNDWASSESFPVPRRIADFVLLPGGDVLLVGITASGQGLCGRYSNDKGFLWGRELPPPSTSGLLLAANDSDAVVFSSQGWHVFSLEDGSEQADAFLPPDAQPFSLAASGDRIYFSGGNGIQSVSIREGFPPSGMPSPAVFDTLAAAANNLAGSADGVVWLSVDGGEFVKIPVSASVKCLSFGEGRTFWLAGASMDPDAQPVVAQANFEGAILRALVPKSDDPRPAKVRASRSSDVFAVLEEGPGLQRFRMLSRNAEGGWNIEWERAIQDAPFFGFVDGNVSANATATRQPASLRIRLEENPLTGDHQEILLQAECGPDGVRLATLDGLPIVNLSQRPDMRRVAIQRGPKPDSLRLLQGNEAAVEEFFIQGLSHITPLSAGTVEIEK